MFYLGICKIIKNKEKISDDLARGVISSLVTDGQVISYFEEKLTEANNRICFEMNDARKSGVTVEREVGL